MSQHAKIKVEDVKAIGRLLGEAFPNHFTITVAFGRDESGKITKTGACEVIAAPSNLEEVSVLMAFTKQMSVEDKASSHELDN
jgi:hypothetical protein